MAEIRAESAAARVSTMKTAETQKSGYRAGLPGKSPAALR